MPASLVSEHPAAASDVAQRHFAARFAFETDCWDVHHAMTHGLTDFVLLDVRSPDAYAAGHLPGAVNIPVGKLVESKLMAYPASTLFVVYCAGPHCNGSTRAALRLASLGRPVKEMIGGVAGWLDEGFAMVAD